MWKICAVCFILCLAGCTVVTAPHPVGENPPKLGPAEWQAWAGTWVSGNGTSIQVEVKDEASGSLGIAWVERQSEGFVLKTQEVLLRSTEGWTYANMKGMQGLAKDTYVWGRIERRDRVILVWLPAPEKFKRLVQDGRLSGNVSTSDVALGPLGMPELRLIRSEAEGVLFEWDKPLVFWKASE